VKKMIADVDAEASTPEFGGRIHPMQLAMDVQDAMGDDDWLVIDGGNTHFWSEIAINLAGYMGKKTWGNSSSWHI
jgi:acetolactate synthase-1/2/3 large subunit